MLTSNTTSSSMCSRQQIFLTSLHADIIHSMLISLDIIVALAIQTTYFLFHFKVTIAKNGIQGLFNSTCKQMIRCHI